jgi:hypothetical protein
MPESPTGSNSASVTGGFPPITMEPELSGGKPPLGQDFNGLFFLLSSHTLYVECGQLYLFNSDLATAIGGYLAGTVLGMSDGSGMWLCTTNGNSNNPDTGGSGWVPIASYGYAAITGLTGGTVTLTAAQSKKPVLVLTGALVSNLTIVLPANVQEWLIINNTTGAFTTTVSAGGANSVQVAQGGFAAPVPVYGIGDGSIYPQTAAATLPSYSQSPTGSTLVQRTNAGYVLATYFNSSASPSENPAIGSVAVMSTAADGYIRFATLANFLSQLGFSTSIAANGYIKLPGGLIVQWGRYDSGQSHNATTSFTVPLNIAFPNAMLQAMACQSGQMLDSTGGYWSTWGYATNQFNVTMKEVNNENTYCACVWIAIGY